MDETLERDRELADLRTAYSQCVESRTPRVRLIEGVSGQGKSHLASAFLEGLANVNANSVGPLLLKVRSTPAENSARTPFDAMGKCLTSIEGEGDDNREFVRRLIDAAVEIVPELLGLVIPGTSLVSAAVKAGLGDKKLSDFVRDRNDVNSAASARTAAQVRTLLKHVAEEAPIVMFLDDVQWADQGSITLIHQLLVEDDLPLYLVLAARSNLEEEGSAGPFALARQEFLRNAPDCVINLDKQADEDFCRSYLEAVFDDAPDVWVQALVETTGGNPQYVSSVVDALSNDLDELGSVTKESARESLNQYGQGLHNLMETMITRQGELRRKILCAGASFGMEFPVEVLLSVFPNEDPFLIHNEIDLMRSKSNLLQESEAHCFRELSWYRFDHHLLFSAAQSMVGRNIHRLQARHFLEFLEDHPHDGSPDRLTVLAGLASRAGQADESANYLHELAEMHNLRGLWEDALKAYEATESLELDLLSPYKLRSSIWQIKIGADHLPSVDRQEAELLLKQQAESAMELGYVFVAAEAFLQAGRSAWKGLRHGFAEEMLRNAQSLIDKAPSEPDDRAKRNALEVYTSLGVVARHTLRFDEAISHYKTVLELTEDSPNQRPRSTALNNLGVVYSIKGDFTESRSCYEQAVAISKRIAAPQSNLLYTANLATAMVRTGEPDRGLELMEDCRTEALQLGGESESRWYRNYGFVLATSGRVGEAVDNYEMACRLLEKTGKRKRPATYIQSIARLALLHITQGEWGLAMDAIGLLSQEQVAEASVMELPTPWFVKGLVAAHAGDTSALSDCVASLSDRASGSDAFPLVFGHAIAQLALDLLETNSTAESISDFLGRVEKFERIDPWVLICLEGISGGVYADEIVVQLGDRVL